MTEASKPRVDWERIELDYRAGIKSVREIAAEHGISHTAINKRSKAEKWDRDLQAKVRAKAEALVSKAAVSAEVSAERLATEKETVDANAAAIVAVRLRHRTDISGLLEEVRELAAELKFSREQMGSLERAVEVLADGDDVDAMRKAMNRALSLGSRAGIAKTLAETIAKMVPLEREAWGLNSEADGRSDFEKMLTEIHGAVA
jgi:hypothetical protein